MKKNSSGIVKSAVFNKKVYDKLLDLKRDKEFKTFSDTVDYLIEHQLTPEQIQEKQDLIENMKRARIKYENTMSELRVILDYMKDNGITYIPEDIFDVMSIETRLNLQSAGIDIKSHSPFKDIKV